MVFPALRFATFCSRGMTRAACAAMILVDVRDDRAGAV